jgi:hypothetical protein
MRLWKTSSATCAQTTPKESEALMWVGVRECFSWVGVALILFAFVGSNWGFSTPQSPSYQLCNLFGALFVGIDAYAQKNYQPMLLNIVWGIVSLVMLFPLLV